MGGMGDGFKHITVTPAEEDGEIIVVGADGAVEDAAASAPGPDRGGVPAPGGGPSDGTVPAPDDPAPGAPAAKPPATGGAAPDGAAPARGGAYRQTSLEDLEGGKMPLAQRIVIAAAIVCIIGALVYYFAVMR